MSWLVMQRLGFVRPGREVLNIAPEHFMLTEGVRIFGAPNYFGCDYDPAQWAGMEYQVRKIDLCGDLSELAGRAFDVIMHNHVLEHVPCAVRATLQRLNSVLRPGGLHAFSIPIYPQAQTSEDLDLTLSCEERRSRFGQADHMRVFGGMDFLLRHVPAEMAPFIDLRTILNETDLAHHGIPTDALTSLNPHHIFAWRKPVVG